MTTDDPALRSQSERPPRRGAALALWVLLVAPLTAVVAACARWEPVMHDGWGHLDWYRRHQLGWRALYEFAAVAYATDNPRLGQLVTVVSYADGPYHAIIASLAAVLMVVLVTALALGRWPRVRRADDAAAAWLAAGALAACLPQLGPMLLYRPYLGNYTWGLVLNLGWLVPYRIALVAPGPRRAWLLPVVLVLGVAAGLCNEHTGPAMLMLGAAAAVQARRARALRAWMLVGIVAFAAGYVALFTAPGQQLRYSGLASQAGVLERVLARGVLGDLAVVGMLVVAMAPAIPLVALGVAERRVAPALPRATRDALLALAAAAVACTLTLLASPKLGERLYLASVALLCAALVGWLHPRLIRAWPRRIAAALVVGVLAFVAFRLVSIYRVVGPIGALRRDRIEHAPPGSAVVVPRYPVGRSRYFLIDDFLREERRKVTAESWGLSSVELAPAP